MRGRNSNGCNPDHVIHASVRIPLHTFHKVPAVFTHSHSMLTLSSASLVPCSPHSSLSPSSIPPSPLALPPTNFISSLLTFVHVGNAIEASL